MSMLGEGVNAVVSEWLVGLVVWVSSGVGLACCVTAVVVCLSVAVLDFVRLGAQLLPPTPDCATIGAHQGEVGAT